MTWQGPYCVIRKHGPVTYEIHHPDTGKATQVYHFNLLKQYKEPPSKPEMSLLIRKFEKDEDVDQTE